MLLAVLCSFVATAWYLVGSGGSPGQPRVSLFVAAGSRPSPHCSVRAAAGSLRQLDAKVTESRPLRFFAYTWGEMSDMPADTQSGMIETFEKWGFTVNPLFQRSTSIEELIAFSHDVEERRSDLGYDIDGVVY